MSEQWRLFLAALRFVTRMPVSSPDAGGPHFPIQALRFVTLVAIVVGAIGAGVYWLAAQLWPTSVAVVLAMAATAGLDARHRNLGVLYWVFALLLKYNALMALSSANLPLQLPANLTLGLIMIAAQAASGALLASVVAGDASHRRSDVHPRAAAGDLGVALLIGLAPAAVLGIPGLIGVACAIVVRMALAKTSSPAVGRGNPGRLEVTCRATEICFYLGALATWKYV